MMGNVSTRASQNEVDMWMKNWDASLMLISSTSKPWVVNWGSQATDEVIFSNRRYNTKSPWHGAKINLSNSVGITQNKPMVIATRMTTMRISTERNASM